MSVITFSTETSQGGVMPAGTDIVCSPSWISTKRDGSRGNRCPEANQPIIVSPDIPSTGRCPALMFRFGGVAHERQLAYGQNFQLPLQLQYDEFPPET